MRPIKNKTYANFMLVLKQIEAKGYNRAEAEKITHHLFAELNPNGKSMEVMIAEVLPNGDEPAGPYPWDTVLTMYRLWTTHCSDTGAALKYGKYVLAVADAFTGYEAAVYEFSDQPEDRDREFWERRLHLRRTAPEPFAESGQAVKWCFDQIG